jgi:hypothetical protein
MLIAPQMLIGAGIGMLISPLFDFILATVTDDEVGSASGVLNALQQLAGAVGVAAIGTVFFSTLSHHGFVTAVNRCIEWELATVPVLILCTLMLPRRAREPEVQPTAASGAAADTAETADRGEPACSMAP